MRWSLCCLVLAACGPASTDQHPWDWPDAPRWDGSLADARVQVDARADARPGPDAPAGPLLGRVAIFSTAATVLGVPARVLLPQVWLHSPADVHALDTTDASGLGCVA